MLIFPGLGVSTKGASGKGLCSARPILNFAKVLCKLAWCVRIAVLLVLC